MKTLVTILALVLALLGASAAKADTVAPELASPYAQALAFWGITSVASCPEGVTVKAVADLGELNGYAEGCEIQIVTGLSRCYTTELMEHEVGHVLGYEHSTDPRSIMYPELDQDHPVCAAEQAAGYERWAAREARRCRHKRRHRSACFESVRELRHEATRLRSP